MSDQYVILTGAINNAGDFLIGERAKRLLARQRPDRKIIEIPRWTPLTDDQLETINDSKALLLTGGPSLQKNLYPGIYPLTSDLAKIKVPVTVFGGGFKSADGDWSKTNSYKFTPESMGLWNKIFDSGLPLSVRDYHTWNIVSRLDGKTRSVLMTGCPALYAIDEIKREKRNKVVFSLGVSFYTKPAMLKVTEEIILGLHAAFGDDLTVAFHHSIDQDRYAEAYGKKNTNASRGNHAILDLLKARDISFEDISGGIDAFKNLYSDARWHIGFRVHAHIFCSSLGIPSILVSEDGRGEALRGVLSGWIFQGIKYQSKSRLSTSLGRLVKAISPRSKAGDTLNGVEVSRSLWTNIKQAIEYEEQTGFSQSDRSMALIHSHRNTMNQFIAALP